MRLQQRQGDRRFLHQVTVPPEPVTTRQGNVIVAGEATDHAHRHQAGTILEAPDGALSLDVTQTTQVVHEEQGPITLEPGLWLVVRQRECSSEAIRRVVD